jgi:hypothetical protein
MLWYTRRVDTLDPEAGYGGCMTIQTKDMVANERDEVRLNSKIDTPFKQTKLKMLSVVWKPAMASLDPVLDVESGSVGRLSRSRRRGGELHSDPNELLSHIER